MTALSREVVRDALAGALTTALSGSGKPVQTVYGYMPDTLLGESPVVLVLSGGTQRRPAGMGARKYDNKFTLEIHYLVYDGDSNPLTPAQREDKVDEVEALAADYCVNNQFGPNPSAPIWRSLDYTFDGSTEITVTKFFDGVPYRLEVAKALLEAPDS